MPTYEYRCPRGHSFDVFQKMSDPAGATCPECGSDAERIIVPGAGLLFRGEGFYITDYRSKDYKEEAAREISGGGEVRKQPAEAKDAGKKKDGESKKESPGKDPGPGGSEAAKTPKASSGGDE